MLKTFLTVGTASTIGVLGAALPSQAAILNLSTCAGVLSNCVVPYTGGTATILVTQPSDGSQISGTPSNVSNNLLMGDRAPVSPPGVTPQTVKITFTAAPNFSLPSISLLPPTNTGAGTPRPFGDFRDNWTATLTGGRWVRLDPGPQDLSTPYPSTPSVPPFTVPGINPPPVAGGSTITWSHPYSLSTKRAYDMNWELTHHGGQISMLQLTYFNSAPESNPLFDDADALRIDVTAREIRQEVPEASTAISSVVVLGLSLLSLRRGK